MPATLRPLLPCATGRNGHRRAGVGNIADLGDQLGPLRIILRRRCVHRGDHEAQATGPPEKSWSGGRRGLATLALLLDLGGLAAELAQVVELGATHVTTAGDLDLGDV